MAMLRINLLFILYVLFNAHLHAQGFTADTSAVARLVEASEQAEKARQPADGIRLGLQALALNCDQGTTCILLRARAAFSTGRSYQAAGSRDSALIFCRMAYHLRYELLKDTFSEDARRALNGLGIAFYESTVLDSALYYYQRAFVLSQRLYGPESKEVASALNNMGVVYRDLGDFTRSRNLQLQTLNIRLRATPPDASLLAQSCYNLGVLYRMMSKPDSAILFLNEGLRYAGQKGDIQRELNCKAEKAACLSMQNRNQEAVTVAREALQRRIQLYGNNPEDPRLAQVYGDFGALLSLNETYDLAQTYLEKALAMLRKQSPGIALAIALSQAAHNQVKINPYDHQAEQWLLEAVNLYKQLRARPKDLAYCYENLGVLAYQTQQNKDAIVWQKEALSLRQSTGDSVSVVVANNLNLLAESYLMTDDFRSALNDANMVVSMLEKSDNTRQLEYKQALIQLARADIGLQQWDDANRMLKQAAASLNIDLNQPDFQQITAISQATKIFKNQAALLLKQIQNGRKDLIPDAQKAVDRNFQLMAFKQRSVTGEEAVLNHRLDLHDMYAQATALALLEGNSAKAFEYSDLDKAQTLRSEYLTRISNDGAPDSLKILLDSIRHIQAEVAFWTQRLFQTGLSKTEQDDATTQLFNNRRRLEALWEMMHASYYEDWQNRFGETNFDLTALRRDLVPAHTALIEFSYAPDVLTLFLLTADTLLVFESAQVERILPLVNGLINNTLSQNRMGPATLDTFAIRSYELFQLLLAQPLAALKADVQHLILVPDGILARIPFSALLTSKPPKGPPAQWPFLIKKYAVSYGFSAALLAEQLKAGPSAAPEFFGGFAPKYAQAELEKRMKSVLREGESNYDLPFAREEVQQLAELTHGKAWLAQDATEARFRASGSNYKVVHLAMHAVADIQHPAFSRLLFTDPGRDTVPEADGNFYAGDLSGLRLDADLVTLSACRTAIGPLMPGESTYSLAYAFTRAGASAVAASLWPANDAFTMKLMTAFYKQMKTGLPKDEALRQAQLALIRQSKEEPELAHPFFWATFEIMGSTRPLGFEK